MSAPPPPRVSIKIAYIGGGSRNWARGLMRDLALAPDLGGALALYDVRRAAAERNVEVGKAIYAHPDARSRFTVSAAASPAAALKGADFVVMSIEPGPMRMRYADLEVPAKFGILQPVGDTVGPGGLLRALRAVPVYVEYAKLIGEHCPRAWVINYTNPMTCCTAALSAGYPGVKAFGCCHEVFGTQHHLARLVQQWFGLAERPSRDEIRLDITGVNHFTVATGARWNGHDLMPRLRELAADDRFFADRTRQAEQRKNNQQWFGSESLIAFDLLRRFGVLGAAGDRHLVEFVPWYLRDEKTLHRWGVILTPYAYRIANAKKKDDYRVGPKLKGSGEEGVGLIRSLLGLREMDTNVNLPNGGQNPDLPLGAVTESYAAVRRDAITPLVAGPYPDDGVLRSHVRRVVANQQATVRAAMERDVDLAFGVLLNDPLVHLPTDEAWKMFGQMLRYVRECLPGWRLGVKR